MKSDHPRLTWRLVTLLVASSMFGCTTSDPDMPRSRTRHRLEMLGEVAKQFDKHQINVFDYRSLPELLQEAGKNSFISEADLEMKVYETDGWRRPFRYEVRNSGSNPVIRIGSAGENGIWEDGGGDDLSVEIRPGDGELDVRFTPGT